MGRDWGLGTGDWENEEDGGVTKAGEQRSNPPLPPKRRGTEQGSRGR